MTTDIQPLQTAIPMFRFACCCLVLLASLPALLHGAAGAEDYPRGELLVEPSELAKSPASAEWVILDTRGKETYTSGHVPGAVRIDADVWKDAFDSQAIEDWSMRIGSLGIAADTTVVVYDDNELKDAARIWWILRYWGATDVRLLNGGWKAWQADDLPTTQAVPTGPDSVTFQARPQEERLATKDELIKSLGAPGVQIVDSRSEAEYCGNDALQNQRAGAIPGAVHLEWKELLDEESGKLKPASEIEQLLREAGIDPKRSTATYCQSGGRASVMAFGLELMGGAEVSNYYPGWSEWGNLEDTPIQK